MSPDAVIDRLKAEWPLIESAPLSAVTVTVILAAVLWAIMHLLYVKRINDLKGRIALRDDQIADYKAKLSVASPDEAKARIDALQAQLDFLKPRQLSSEQIQKIAMAAARHNASIYFQSDLSSPDAIPYREQFVEPFERAKWKVIVGQIGAPPSRAPSGLGVFVNDPPTTPQKAVLEAFREASVAFDKMFVTHNYPHVVVQINSRAPSLSL